MKNYPQIMDKILTSAWVITPESLQNILNILDRKMSDHEEFNENEFTFGPQLADTLGKEDTQQSGVGILPINGPIFPKATMMTKMSGATSIEQLQTDFREMLSNDLVTSIVLNIDSPGGMSDLIMEMGDEIYNARGTKPIVAVANTTAASAAYWLGSQADQFYVTPSGQVGSVGVYTVHQDKSAQQEKEGISTTLVSAGKFKVEGSPYGPLSDETKTHMQERVNETYAEFISAVARGRGTSDEFVAEAYADGRTYRAKAAHALGMVDGVETFDSVVGKLVNMDTNYVHSSSGFVTTNASNTTMNKEGTMEPFSPEMLEALGLSEEATTDEITQAVMQMSLELAPLRNAVAKEVAFAEQFPEQAALLADLKERDISTSAKLFSDSYAQFTSGEGFSAVALEAIEGTHKKISTGVVTHDDFKEFLNLVAEGNAIVDYTEHGTTRGADDTTADNAKDAGTKLASLARAAQVEAGGVTKLSWGDAIAQVASEHPELARQYSGGGE